MSLQTPRILPAHLHAFHPSSSGPRSTHTVRLLGTVTALRGDTATITCGGNGDVTLILKPDSHLQMGKLVEVVGKVADLEGGQVCIQDFFVLLGQFADNGARALVFGCLEQRTGATQPIVVSLFFLGDLEVYGVTNVYYFQSRLQDL